MEFDNSGPSSALTEILAKIFLVRCLDAIGMQFTPFAWFPPIINFKVKEELFIVTGQQIYRQCQKKLARNGDISCSTTLRKL
jgi:hypothetical protein